MSIVKKPVSSAITINLDASGVVTHAWQQISFVIEEDGKEISRQLGPSENIEPDKLKNVFPQAALVKQVDDLLAAAKVAAKDISDRDKSIKAAAEDLASRDAKLAKMSEQLTTLQAAHDDAKARNAAAIKALSMGVAGG